MSKLLKRTKKVSICAGASCRAWDSEKVAQELYEGWNTSAERKKLKICRVSCLNQCGGGVSVKILSSGPVVKIRKPTGAIKIVARMPIPPEHAEPARPQANGF